MEVRLDNGCIVIPRGRESDAASLLGVSIDFPRQLVKLGIKFGQDEATALDLLLRAVYGDPSGTTTKMCRDMGINPQAIIFEIARIAFSDDGYIASRQKVIVELAARRFLPGLDPEKIPILLSALKKIRETADPEEGRMRVGSAAKMRALETLMEIEGSFKDKRKDPERAMLFVINDKISGREIVDRRKIQDAEVEDENVSDPQGEVQEGDLPEHQGNGA